MKEKPPRAFNSTFAQRTKPMRKKPLAAVWPGKRQSVQGLPKTRKPLKKQSQHRKHEQAEYLKQRIDFLRRQPACGACLVREISPAPAVQVHHQRGRIGRLLLDERFWIGVCRPCHDEIHAHPTEARKLGLLAPIREWNTYPAPGE